MKIYEHLTAEEQEELLNRVRGYVRYKYGTYKNLAAAYGVSVGAVGRWLTSVSSIRKELVEEAGIKVKTVIEQ